MAWYKKILSEKEIYSILISVFILGIGFGFDDGAKTFVLLNWIKNFFIVLGLVFVSLMAHLFFQKYFAYRHNSVVEYRLWFVKRFGFKKDQRADLKNPNSLGIPMGIILSLFLTLMTNGKVPFAWIGTSNVSVIRHARAGRKTIDLANYEDALIQLAGPMANVILIILAVFFSKFFPLYFSKFVMINFLMALFAMIPFSSLAGAKIFFGSRNLYVFGLLMIILGFALKDFGIFGGAILGLLMALLLTGAYYYKWENN